MNHLATSSVTTTSAAPLLLGRGFGPRSVRAPGHLWPGVERRWSDDGVIVALAITAAAVMMAVAMGILGSLAMAGASAAEPNASVGRLARADGVGAAGAKVSVQVTATRVFVREGDSLWSIALRVAPDEDPRRVVLRLDRARGRSGPLQAGEVIRIAASR